MLERFAQRGPGARDIATGNPGRKHVPDELRVIGRDPESRARDRVRFLEAPLIEEQSRITASDEHGARVELRRLRISRRGLLRPADCIEEAPQHAEHVRVMRGEFKRSFQGIRRPAEISIDVALDEADGVVRFGPIGRER
jgi:hypothetical protein